MHWEATGFPASIASFSRNLLLSLSGFYSRVMGMSQPSSGKILVPGTVLLDIYEDTRTTCLGGAEFNFAYHAHQLCGNVDFLGRVGRDVPGRLILGELKRRKFPVRFIQSDPDKPTKTVLIRKNARQEPVYLIAVNTASEHLADPGLSRKELAAYGLIYFGTTLQRGPQSRDILRGLLARCDGSKFCDINLRADQYTRETVEYSLRTCDILKLNHEELKCLARMFRLTGGTEERLEKLSRRFSIPVICLTQAKKDSLLYRDGVLTSRVPPPCRVVDTVGAGDGFSACLAVGLLRGWDSDRLLDFAGRFAAAICGINGAVPADADFYLPFRAEL